MSGAEEALRVVRGAPSHEELAVVMALLSARVAARGRDGAPAAGYPAWRAARLAALRRTSSR